MQLTSLNSDRENEKKKSDPETKTEENSKESLKIHHKGQVTKISLKHQMEDDN